MGNVVAPVKKARPILAGMSFVPLINIDHAIAAVDFDYRSDEHDHVRAYVLDIWGIVDRQTISQFHQGRGSAGLRGVDGTGDVVDGPGLVEELPGFGIIQADGARISKLSQARVVLFRVGKEFGVRDGGGDHFPAFLGVPDGDDLYSWTACLQ